MKEYTDYSLLAHNTFGIDARCHRFIALETEEDVLKMVREMDDNERRSLLILGAGSNLVLTGDYPGIVLHSHIKGIRVVKDEENEVILQCGSGETFDDIVAFCVNNDYHGLENLSLIPGEVGASAVQNIGAYGVEAKDVIYKVQVVDLETGEQKQIANEECCYAYRQSKFKTDWKNRFFITFVYYKLSKTFIPHLDYGNIRSSLEQQGISNPTAQQLRNTIIAIRNAKLPDPKILGNAGSFFMNPIVSREKYESLASHYLNMPHYILDNEHVKIPAGWMIDQCGWKGKTLGKVGVYEKQALVLVNRGGASGTDVVHLCKTIQEDVKKKFGIEIHPEANII